MLYKNQNLIIHPRTQTQFLIQIITKFQTLTKNSLPKLYRIISWHNSYL